MKTVGIRMSALAGGLAAAVILVSSLAGAGEPVPAADWPQWRGPNRDAKAAATGLKNSWESAPPKLLWEAAGLGAGFSSMSIVGDRIYTMGDIGEDQFVMALDRADGTLIWKTRVGPRWDDQYPGPRGTPTVDGDRVYAMGTEGNLVCVDAASGKVRWKKNLEKAYGGRVMTVWKWAESPLVDGDR
ncbi:MAG: PQQ-binding-like beta-propeller repeat protein, partial [Candidatus Acidiferrales bacterium]